MPTDMAVFSAPQLPKQTSRALVTAVQTRLAALLSRMEATDFMRATDITENLLAWPESERLLAGDLLGFGEVSAYAVDRRTADTRIWRVQETAFPGLWRVLSIPESDKKSQPIVDFLQAGSIPPVLGEVMLAASAAAHPLPERAEGLMNAPALMREIHARARAWKEGDAPCLFNFTLLPVTPADLEALYGWLGHREVSILSRGYGNCRMSSTRLSYVWWVQYFNSMDTLILNTLEITVLPEAALAAREDYEDSRRRLLEHLTTLKAA
jgi:hydrogenase-1 operon protein HyaF